MATTTDFTEHPKVLEAIQRIRIWQQNGPTRGEVSDLLDADGNQYVDLVMEGGGVLGLALVGYCYALEQAGIRFKGLGGTSAGAINALAIAAVDTPERAKTAKVLEIVANIPMYDFVDGGSAVRRLIESLVRRRTGWALLVPGLRVLPRFLKRLGLNPGDAFLRWALALTEQTGTDSVARLMAQMRLPPSLKNRVTGQAVTLAPRFKVVAADITTETKVVLPEMADLYFGSGSDADPGRFLRASMSVPGFFEPYRVPVKSTDVEKALWKIHAGYGGNPPEEVTFADGGIVSNFPIDLFHVDNGQPQAPTFGIQLEVDRAQPLATHKLLPWLGALFNTARHCADYSFLKTHPDFKHLVAEIPTGDHYWLDFDMTDPAKVDLFRRGVEAAEGFLNTFNWHEYKRLRGRLAN